MMIPRWVASQHGFTIMEIMVASIIATVVAAGTLTSFVTAGRIMAAQSNLSVAEANTYAQDSVEYFRNNIACQAPWFDGNCNYVGPAGWVSDNLPNAPGGGSESVLGTTAKRCYRVQPVAAGACATANGCYSVEVRVCWNNALVNCPC